MVRTVEDPLKLLHEKLDRIIELLEANPIKPRRLQKTEMKAAPLGVEEISRHKELFERLYLSWDNGGESTVERAFDEMAADDLRRFADANNLNVTSKTPKQKIMKLIAGRFRERRQLLKPHFNRRSPLD